MSPTINAFLSYAHSDNAHDSNRITELRKRLEGEIRAQTGLTTIRIFQDRKDLGWGDDWSSKITSAAKGSVFLIPIVTPSYFGSDPCREEFEAFRARGDADGGTRVVLPIYYIGTEFMDDPTWQVDNDWAKAIAAAQWADWRKLRFEPWEGVDLMRHVEQMALDFKKRLKELGVITPPGTIAQGVKPAAVKPKAPKSSKTASSGVDGSASESGAESSPTSPGASATTRRELIVDPSGKGTHKTLVDAVAAARADDVIRVTPGTYEGSVVIDKSISVIGEGRREDIILTSSSGNTIKFDAPFGRVSNVTIRREQANGDRAYACWILSGQLELDGCDISSESLACVAITGTAEPTLRHNRIHSGNQGGVFVYDSGRGTIEDNDIFGNVLSGIEIKDSADPVVRRNRIRNAKQAGVVAYDGGRGTIEDNDIFGNVRSGVEIKTSADPVVRRNRIHDGKQNGMMVLKGGRGTIEDNDITSNTYAGIEVKESGDPIVRGNRINRNGYQAVWIHKGGRGRYENNDLRDNAKGAWRIDDDCLPHVILSGNVEK